MIAEKSQVKTRSKSQKSTKETKNTKAFISAESQKVIQQVLKQHQKKKNERKASKS